MPYPNSHAGRIADPAGFIADSFRSKEIEPGINMILGKKQGSDAMETQAVRFDAGKFTPDQAKQWLEKHSMKPIMFEPASGKAENEMEIPPMDEEGNKPGMPMAPKSPMPPVPGKEEKQDGMKTCNMDSVEIFRTGIWNGDRYTEEDFDDMVKAHKMIGSKVKPFMKLGHDKKQSLVQKDGFPVAGWITNLRREGQRLLADIVNIPRKIYDLIQSKAYGRFSPEIFWDFADPDNKEKKHPRVLSAVALLGADTPACMTMDDFINLYGMVESAHYAEGHENIKKYDEVETPKESTMTKEEIEKLESEKRDYAVKAETVERELALQKSENETLRKYKEDAEKGKAVAEVEKFLSENKDKITPVQVKFYSALILKDRTGIKEYAYTDGKEAKTLTDLDTFGLIKEIVANMPKFVDFDEKSYAQDQTKVSTKKHDDEKTDLYNEHETEIKEYATKNNVSYKDAMKAVLKNKE